MIIVRREPAPSVSTACRVHVGRGRFVTVDRSAFVMVTRYRWHLRRSSSRRYAARKIQRDGKITIVYLHRWLMHCPPNMETHHIDGDTFNCQRHNLEIVTPAYHGSIRTRTQKRA